MGLVPLGDRAALQLAHVTGSEPRGAPREVRVEGHGEALRLFAEWLS